MTSFPWCTNISQTDSHPSNSIYRHTIVVVSNTTSNDDFKNWVQDILLVGLSDQDFETVATLYPQDPTQGSPFNTSLLNTVTPENKRIAAIYGDVTFQAPRSSFLSTVSSTNPTWSYLNKNLKLTPYLGSFHAADLFNLVRTDSKRKRAGQNKW